MCSFLRRQKAKKATPRSDVWCCFWCSCKWPSEAAWRPMFAPDWSPEAVLQGSFSTALRSAAVNDVSLGFSAWLVVVDPGLRPSTAFPSCCAAARFPPGIGVSLQADSSAGNQLDVPLGARASATVQQLRTASEIASTLHRRPVGTRT